ncbi:hypothetical protein ACFQ9X_10625 [Catenulispora yoronensis]
MRATRHRQHRQHRSPAGSGTAGRRVPRSQAAASADPRTLTTRLAALEGLLKDTEDRLTPAVAEEVGRILLRVHERIALSPDHVVTAIAGATGSGKSSLFNALIRFDLAPVGPSGPPRPPAWPACGIRTARTGPGPCSTGSGWGRTTGLCGARCSTARIGGPSRSWRRWC